jgi:phenylalanyl-tRNA synthetase alpha subunit
VVRYLTELSDFELRGIGLSAQERVLREHTSEHRARQFEAAVEQALRPAESAVLAG